MKPAGKTFPERMDDLVRSTGLYHLTMIDRPTPRNLRIAPLTVLVALPLGYAFLVRAIDWGSGSLLLAMAGALLFFFGLLAAHMLRFLGPRIVPDFGKSLDERETALKARAGSVSGTILTALAILGCFYCGFAGVFGTWMPRETLDWVYLGLLLEGWWLTLPVLVASWLQPRDMVEDE